MQQNEVSQNSSFSTEAYLPVFSLQLYSIGDATASLSSVFSFLPSSSNNMQLFTSSGKRSEYYFIFCLLKETFYKPTILFLTLTN